VMPLEGAGAGDCFLLQAGETFGHTGGQMLVGASARRS
jgi:hypothetical protein